MKRRAVILAPEARDDLIRLHDWIAGVAGPSVAIGYIDRLERYCLGFELAAERGHKRDDVRPGLRICGFEKRVTIAFTVAGSTVTILRLFHGGQAWDGVLLK